MTDCGHATVTVPDPLPPVIEAALRLRRSDALGLDRIVSIIIWAVLAERLTHHRSEWSPALACALVRQHPDVRQPGPGVCTRIADAFTATGLAEALPDRTELGLAERVAVLSQANLAWSEDGKWRVWTGPHWTTDQTDALAMESAKRVARVLLPIELEQADRLVVAAKRADPEAKTAETKALVADAKAAATFARQAQSARTMRAALELLRGEPTIRVPAERWDSDDRLMCVADGTVELRPDGPVLRDHRRDDHLTRQARGAFGGADRSIAGTEFERFIGRALPDPEVRAFLQRVLGYALLGHNARRVLLLLVGPTSSGKSTLLEAIVHALGGYASSFKLSLFRSESDPGKPRPDLIAALPRRVIVTTETSDRWSLDADAVKRLTGNDSDSARALHSGAYLEQRPAFVPIIATNSAPKIRGADAALWRRIIAIPFDVTISRDAEDAGLGERLRAEADVILGWLLDGYAAYCAAGGFGDPPKACQDTAYAVRADMTLIDRWLADCTEADAAYAERGSDLADDWHRWCRVHKVALADQVNAIALGGELSARGYGLGFGGPEKRRHRVRTGLRLRPDRDLTYDVHPADCRCTSCVGPVRQRWASSQ